MSTYAEVAGLTDKEWAIVKEAAQTAAPVFAARGWEWATHNPDDREKTAVPDVFRIAETLVRLVQRVKQRDSGSCGSGRFNVEAGTNEEMFEREHFIYITLDMTTDDSCGYEQTDGLNPNYEFSPEEMYA